MDSSSSHLVVHILIRSHQDPDVSIYILLVLTENVERAENVLVHLAQTGLIFNSALI